MSLYISFYKLLIMCLVVQDVKSDKVKFVQSKFDVGDFNHGEKKVKSSNEDKTYEAELMKPFIKRKNKKTCSDDVYVDENGVYHYVIPHCSKCNSRNVNKHDSNERDLIFEDGTERRIKVKKYKCKDCGRDSQVEFKGQYEPYSSIPSKVKKQSLGNLMDYDIFLFEI